MKNTDTSQYLALAMHSLESVLMPELTSPDAKATAEIMRQVLGELIKREHFTPRLLDEHIAEGLLLAERMTALLLELGIHTAEAAEMTAEQRSHKNGFPLLATTHTTLTERITLLANALSGNRDKAGDPAQQDYLSTLLHKAAAWEYAYYSAQREATVNIPPVPSAVKGAPLSQEVLQTFLRTQYPSGERCGVTAFTSIPGGFGKQTFRATFNDGVGKSHNLIVRKSDPTPMLRHGAFFIDQEFYLVKSIFATGFPVAEPLFLGAGIAEVDADFYVMSALQGAVPSSLLGAGSSVIPESVLLHMAELMAQLHQLKLDNFTDYLTRIGQTEMLSDTVESCYRRSLGEWQTYYSGGDHLPSPYLSFMLDWLQQHVPHDTRRPVLVHGDFNVHNILAQDGRITGVLDWECSMFGAPEQDLAYIKPVISKLIGWDRFIAHYQSCGGPEINDDTLNFYMAFAATRISIAFNKGVNNLQHGLTRDIRYAVVELGLTPEFMNMALSSTVAADKLLAAP